MNALATAPTIGRRHDAGFGKHLFKSQVFNSKNYARQPPRVVRITWDSFPAAIVAPSWDKDVAATILYTLQRCFTLPNSYLSLVALSTHHVCYSPVKGLQVIPSSSPRPHTSAKCDAAGTKPFCTPPLPSYQNLHPNLVVSITTLTCCWPPQRTQPSLACRGCAKGRRYF